MNRKAVLTLGIGVIVAGLAIYMIQERLSNSPTSQDTVQTMETVPVVVASISIPYGTKIVSDEFTKIVDWPASAVPPGAFSTVEELFGVDTEPRVALTNIVAGEAILATKVSGFGGRATLSSKVDDKTRAFTIRVNDVTGVAGFLLPGDRVDVMLTREGKTRDDKITDVILQNIIVRGIDQIADQDEDNPVVVRAVTVQVTPQESQKLALASEVGSLSLSLRNVNDVESTEFESISVEDLTNDVSATKTKPVTPVKKRKPRTVKVIRGNESSTTTF